MPAYDDLRHSPAAPIACVVLRNPTSGSTVDDVELLIDTGADATLLPRSALNRILVAPLPNVHYELMGFDGAMSVAQVAVADMVFLGRTYRGKYLLIEGNEGVLGRDILNHVAVLFDGPSREWKQVTN